MNANLLKVVKDIVTQYGEQVLSEPKRVSAFFADLAKDEPKPQKNAFLKCLEHGFVQILNNTAEPDRALCKQQLAQKLHEEEGLDLGLCGETLELLAAVLFGEAQQKKNYCKNCGKELQEEWKFCPYCSISAASISTMSESNISGNSHQTNKVNYSQEIQAITGVVKKNELTSLRVLSIIRLFIIGLIIPIGGSFTDWFFWDFMVFIILIFQGVFFLFFIALLILALVKGKKYNLKATRTMAKIEIGLFIFSISLAIFVWFGVGGYDLVYLFLVSGFLFILYGLAFSIVTLVQLRKATPKKP